VIIIGESGTGKEIIARIIHYASDRKDFGFYPINCSAIPETLLESEFFGHKKGTFTGAVDNEKGLFELADKGTLFLDEIGDMPLGIQAKFLRVLEENSFERVGGTKNVHTDVRIITATNRNLKELISKGLFRSDLYFRLNVISCTLPPLRDRPEDIPLLIEHFIEIYNRKYNKNVSGLSKELTQKISTYRWPGNIRELQNLINQAVLLSEGKEIKYFNLYDNLDSSNARDLMDELLRENLPLHHIMERISAYYEKRIIKDALMKYGTRSKTAEALGITRKTLFRKIERYGF
jgi:transcriptional regulator with PAS, ATPase and Fis domain